MGWSLNPQANPKSEKKMATKRTVEETVCTEKETVEVSAPKKLEVAASTSASAVSINPYLYFDGTCKQAMEFYAATFNGSLERVVTFADAPGPMGENPAVKDRIMHSTVNFGKNSIMAADTCPGMCDCTFGDNVQISIALVDAEEGGKLFKALSEGGTVNMPFAKQFWGATFGTLKDKFGVAWMINCQPECGEH